MLNKVLFCLLFLGGAHWVSAQNMVSDEDAVKAAIEDYVLALYNVEPERIARSVDTRLHKLGYYDYQGEALNHVQMTYEQLYQLAGQWNKSGKQADEKSPRQIELYEVNDRTASAKLTAVWGIDFMHLAKVKGKWKIINVMWQR